VPLCYLLSFLNLVRAHRGAPMLPIYRFSTWFGHLESPYVTFYRFSTWFGHIEVLLCYLLSFLNLVRAHRGAPMLPIYRFSTWFGHIESPYVTFYRFSTWFGHIEVLLCYLLSLLNLVRAHRGAPMLPFIVSRFGSGT
jgi:hypothetical protein